MRKRILGKHLFCCLYIPVRKLGSLLSLPIKHNAWHVSENQQHIGAKTPGMKPTPHSQARVRTYRKGCSESKLLLQRGKMKLGDLGSMGHILGSVCDSGIPHGTNLVSCVQLHAPIKVGSNLPQYVGVFLPFGTPCPRFKQEPAFRQGTIYLEGIHLQVFAAGPCNLPSFCSKGECSTEDGSCMEVPDAAKNGAECRAQAGPCDVAEVCSDGVCGENKFAAASTVCRAAKGVCDVEETCTGDGANCVPDKFRPAGFICRSAKDVCDVADTCTGDNASCGPDKFRPSSYACRSAKGICDVAETCTGDGANCVPDKFRPSGFTCRSTKDVCDEEESCTGDDANCPADQSVSELEATSCSSNGACPNTGQCMSGRCGALLHCSC